MIPACNCRYAAFLALSLFLGLSLSLAACSGFLIPSTPAPSPSPSPSATVTATIVWFPPTNTPTLFPTPVSLPKHETRPGVGAAFFSDNFDTNGLWTTAISDLASAILDRNRLTLVSSSSLMLVSLRSEPVLGNFYAEITARTSLCRDKDEYGLLFRVNGLTDFYRFALTCNGQERVDRVRSGGFSFIQPLTPSGDAPTGAPGEVKISVWAVGAELRFFLNDRYQFTVHDPVFRQGTLGVFVKPGVGNAMTVSFSNLVVYQVSYNSPTPSPAPSRTPEP